MAENLVLMKVNEEIKQLSLNLGFTSCLFLDTDFVLISEKNPNQLSKKIKEAKNNGKKVIVKPQTEELLRFVLEKTSADLIFGQELINLKDSVHFRKGGLDQILCRIAREKDKLIGFSFTDILIAEPNQRSQLMGRMMVNIKLCQKYKVPIFFSNFSSEIWQMRSNHDLGAFWQILGGIKNNELFCR